jgi:hypothetical protein
LDSGQSISAISVNGGHPVNGYF